MVHVLGKYTSFILYMLVFCVSAATYRSDGKTQNTSLSRSRINTVFVAALPVILAAYRYFVGTDFPTYYGLYGAYKSMSFNEAFTDVDTINGINIGLFFSSKIASIFKSDKVFWGITALLTYLPIVVAIKKQWRNINGALALFVYLNLVYVVGLNIIKQTIAGAIIFWGLKYVYERKPVKFLLVIAVAYLFHTTAFVAISLYFMYDPKGEMMGIKKLLILGLAFTSFYFIDAVLSGMGGRWENYLEVEGTRNISFFINLFWVMVFWLFRKKLIAIDSRNDFLILMYTVGEVFTMIGFWMVFGKRVANYFTIAQVLLLAQLPDAVGVRYRGLFKIGVAAFVIINFVVFYVIFGHSTIIPYIFKM